MRRIIHGLLALCLSAACAADPQSALDLDDLSAFVDGFVEGRMRAHQVAGVTVSVVHGGTLVFARGYGLDDVQRGRPVDPQLSA